MVIDNKILVLDFGGQYNQSIVKRVRDLNVYCEIYPYSISVDKIIEINPKGIIFTGGPSSVYLKDAPLVDIEIFNLGIPILGLCYGCQLIGYLNGCKVVSGNVKEYGKTLINYDLNSVLLKGNNSSDICWMSHSDYISELSDDFDVIGYTSDCPYAIIKYRDKDVYGVQFHPEVSHTNNGDLIFKNFIYDICRAKSNWFIDELSLKLINDIKDCVKDDRVLLGLSGGVDSTVLALLLSKAIGKNLYCVYVDHGLMRKNETKEICDIFSSWDMNFICLDKSELFLEHLKGVVDPEDKRKTIGELFVRVFESEAVNYQNVKYLAQGTIYPDVIESGLNNSATIKSHHNVGGLPKDLNFEILEPFRYLFKDEIRELGLAIGLDYQQVYRQPFPGPGLAIRIIGEVNQYKLDILKEADYIFRSELEKYDIVKDINQYFVVLTNTKTVGVMGDYRTYDYTIALRAVSTSDFMTADFVRIPYDILESISSNIINKVKGINRVVYDITTKPPSTIEWE